jgi:hypothetical protein
VGLGSISWWAWLEARGVEWLTYIDKPLLCFFCCDGHLVFGERCPRCGTARSLVAKEGTECFSSSIYTLLSGNALSETASLVLAVGNQGCSRAFVIRLSFLIRRVTSVLQRSNRTTVEVTLYPHPNHPQTRIEQRDRRLPQPNSLIQKRLSTIQRKDTEESKPAQTIQFNRVGHGVCRSSSNDHGVEVLSSVDVRLELSGWRSIGPSERDHGCFW